MIRSRIMYVTVENIKSACQIPPQAASSQKKRRENIFSCLFILFFYIFLKSEGKKRWCRCDVSISILTRGVYISTFQVDEEVSKKMFPFLPRQICDSCWVSWTVFYEFQIGSANANREKLEGSLLVWSGEEEGGGRKEKVKSSFFNRCSFGWYDGEGRASI